ADAPDARDAPPRTGWRPTCKRRLGPAAERFGRLVGASRSSPRTGLRGGGGCVSAFAFASPGLPGCCVLTFGRPLGRSHLRSFPASATPFAPPRSRRRIPLVEKL